MSLMVSLGLTKFIPPNSNLVVSHVLPDEPDDEVKEDKSNSKIRKENTEKILKAVNDGCETVAAISLETELADKTVRIIVELLCKCGLVEKVKQRKTGCPNHYYPA